MERKINTVIGIDRQNNSGGYFIQNDDVQIYVAVEGVDKQHADSRFTEIIRPYSSFCPCCGERWYGLDYDDWSPSLKNFKDPEKEDEVNCVLHLIDGTKKKCVYTD